MRSTLSEHVLSGLRVGPHARRRRERRGRRHATRACFSASGAPSARDGVWWSQRRYSSPRSQVCDSVWRGERGRQPPWTGISGPWPQRRCWWRTSYEECGGGRPRQRSSRTNQPPQLPRIRFCTSGPVDASTTRAQPPADAPYRVAGRRLFCFGQEPPRVHRRAS